MNVPDGAVWASIPTLAGCLLWMAKHYIADVAGQTPKRKKLSGLESGQEAEDDNPVLSMTVRQYREFSDFLIKELNGRYLVANGERFKSVETKLDNLQEIMEDRTEKFSVIENKLDHLTVEVGKLRLSGN